MAGHASERVHIKSRFIVHTSHILSFRTEEYEPITSVGLGMPRLYRVSDSLLARSAHVFDTKILNKRLASQLLSQSQDHANV